MATFFRVLGPPCRPLAAQAPSGPHGSWGRPGPKGRVFRSFSLSLPFASVAFSARRGRAAGLEMAIPLGNHPFQLGTLQSALTPARDDTHIRDKPRCAKLPPAAPGRRPGVWPPLVVRILHLPPGARLVRGQGGKGASYRLQGEAKRRPDRISRGSGKTRGPLRSLTSSPPVIGSHQMC